MEYFCWIFLALLIFSRADEDGKWRMEQPIYKLPGEKVVLLYTSNKDISACSFTTPDTVQISIILGNNSISTLIEPAHQRPQEWSWKWLGIDSKKDCGIQINRADMADSGRWTATIVTSTKVVQEQEKDARIKVKYVNVTILDTTDRVILHPSTIAPIHTSPVLQTIPMNITCTAFDTHGNRTFTWWIGNNLLGGNVSDYCIKNNTDEPDSDQYIYMSQVLFYVPDSSHDGKQLICNTSYSQYENDELVNKTNIASIDITIFAPPVPPKEGIVLQDYPLGDNSIGIQFHSNPEPEHIFWMMHDMEEPLADNQTRGRYISQGWQPVDLQLTRRRLVSSSGDYIASLDMSKLSRSDAGIANTIRVENIFGNTSYTFYFHAIQGSTVGEIAGVFVALTVGLIPLWVLVGMVIKNIIRKKSRKITHLERTKDKNERREESRTQGQDNPECETVAM